MNDKELHAMDSQWNPWHVITWDALIYAHADTEMKRKAIVPCVLLLYVT